MDQVTKPAAATEEERKERVLQVLRSAGEPLSPIQIAERIGEGWCMWNGSGFGSAVKPLLRKIGAKKSIGKWALKAEITEEPGCIGEMGLIPPSVMSAARWERLKADMESRQQM